MAHGVGLDVLVPGGLAAAGHNRIVPERKRTKWTLAVCIALVVATTIWSFTGPDLVPLPHPARLPNPGDEPEADRVVASLDTAPFESAIWRPLPEEAIPSLPPPPPAAPLKVALLGIDHAADGTLRAVIYHHASDTVLVLRDGDSLQDRVLRLVGMDAVEFVAPKGDVQRLTMLDIANAASTSPARRGGAR